MPPFDAPWTIPQVARAVASCGSAGASSLSPAPCVPRNVQVRGVVRDVLGGLDGPLVGRVAVLVRAGVRSVEVDLVRVPPSRGRGRRTRAR